MTNEPTAEEIEALAKRLLVIINDRPWDEAMCTAFAKWHLTQLAQVTKERDELRSALENSNNLLQSNAIHGAAREQAMAQVNENDKALWMINHRE